MNGKTKVYSIVLALMLAVVLCGCGTKEKPEKEVIADLQASRWFISETLEIKSYEITKRQTDVENKRDIVYVTVHTNEPEMTCDLSYVMEYVLYNDGWVLEAVRKDEEGTWLLQGLTTERIAEDVVADDEFYENLKIKSCVIEEEVDSYNDGQYSKRVCVEVLAGNGVFYSEASHVLTYQITGNSWEKTSIMLDTRDYWPSSGPITTSADALVKTLKTDDHIVKVKYDAYKYKETDNSNLRQRVATVYYTAEKKWDFCTETYLIAIPYSFSLKEGNATWTCEKSEIKSELQNVNFKIQGTRWKQGYVDDGGWDSALSGYANVDLKINNIQATEDPETYTANISCNASSSEYSFYCKTGGNVNAKLKYSRPGEYYLFVTNPSGKTDAYWSGTFIFSNSASRDYDRGVFWQYSSIGVITNTCKLKQVT